jgi:hypothetical protein
VFFLPNQPVISKFQLKAFDMCESVCFFYWGFNWM